MAPTRILALAALMASAALPARPAIVGAAGDDSVFAVAVLAAPQDGAASALTRSNKGVQRTPDNQHVLVSKDVGVERWAIALNADDSIIGNVFLCDGSAPVFVWCAKTEDDHNPDFPNRVIAWQCFGADPCVAVPCGAAAQWPLINGHVALKGSFFLP